MNRDQYVLAYVYNDCIYGKGWCYIPKGNLDGSQFQLVGGGTATISIGVDTNRTHWVIKQIYSEPDLHIYACEHMAHCIPPSFVACIQEPCGVKRWYLYSLLIPDKTISMDLHDCICMYQAENPLPSDLILSICRGLIECVCNLNTFAVHRDISPENFLLTSVNGFWMIQLIDLDDMISPWVVDFEGNLGPNQRYEPLRGKPKYIAPELIRAAKDPSYRPELIPADLWSLGCVILVLMGIYWEQGDGFHRSLFKSGCTDDLLAINLPDHLKQSMESTATQTLCSIVKSLLCLEPSERKIVNG